MSIDNWNLQLKTSQAAFTLAQELGISPIIGQLLVNRKIDNPSDAKTFLNPENEIDWPIPDFLSSMIDFFKIMINEKKKIVIFGDYDVDGLTGTTVLYTFLKQYTEKVFAYLPTREEGYGLNLKTVKRFHSQQVSLIITVDCGISNHKEIEWAKNNNIETIITDHHGMPDQIPNAKYILHPKFLKIDKLNHLAGVGMATWLTYLLFQSLSSASIDKFNDCLDLLAIGTIGDMTPLIGFNRQLVKKGLEQIQISKRVGLIALLALCQLDCRKKTITETDLAFQIIPHLNAAGRLETPQIALDLLLEDNPDSAKFLAKKLQKINKKRKQVCKDVFIQALRMINLSDQDSSVIVLADYQWLHGVLGIVCSQLVERFNKPVFLISLENKQGKGSARAPEGYDILEALKESKSFLIKFGGHKLAGGFSIDEENINSLNKQLDLVFTKQKLSIIPSQIDVDLEISPKLINSTLYNEIRSLAPFGQENPSPKFISKNIPISHLKPDKSGLHLFGKFENLPIKAWKKWNDQFININHFDLIYSIQLDFWLNKTELALHVSDIRPSILIESKTKLNHKLSKPDILLEFKDYVYLPCQDSTIQLNRSQATNFKANIIDWRSFKNKNHKLEQLRKRHHHNIAYYFHQSFKEIKNNSDTFEHLVLLDIPESWERINSILNQLNCTHLHLFLPSPIEKKLSFYTLLKSIEFLKEIVQKNGFLSKSLPNELNLSPEMCFYHINILFDLGILTYDNGRCSIDYQNKRYDLMNSQNYICYLKHFNQRQKMNHFLTHLPLFKIQEALSQKDSQTDAIIK